MNTPAELAYIAARAADMKKCEDLVVLHLTDTPRVCDYVVVCSGNTDRHVDSIVDGVREAIHTNTGLSPLCCEGRTGLSWVVVDYGALMVHVMRPDRRSHYDLESLYETAERVTFNFEPDASDAPEE